MFEHFVQAQNLVYGAVTEELKAGRKRTHWMWFVFPQLRALGRSERAHRFGIADLAEARLYFAHPVLGRRLRECTALVLAHPDQSAHDIFGSPDDIKFRSSMTLFEAASADEETARPFREALELFCAGERDALTLRLIGGR